jgi:hypothetical protein
MFEYSQRAMGISAANGSRAYQEINIGSINAMHVSKTDRSPTPCYEYITKMPYRSILNPLSRSRRILDFQSHTPKNLFSLLKINRDPRRAKQILQPAFPEQAHATILIDASL